jgi:hypothetical protein
MRDHQIVAAARVARCRKPELARRVAAKKIAAHDPVADDVARHRRHTLVVERCAAASTRNVRLLANRNVRREDLRAERIEQER